MLWCGDGGNRGWTLCIFYFAFVEKIKIVFTFSRVTRFLKGFVDRIMIFWLRDHP